MELLYRDEHMAVCRKAPGEVSEHVQDKTGVPDKLAALLGCPPEEVYVVHRLDRTTGGLMVFALDRKTAADISARIQNGAFGKEYLAVVQGIPEASGDMTDLLYFDRGRGKAFVVTGKRAGAKEARLRYIRIGTAEWRGEEISLCRVRLETGRTHQIRVQFGARKLPLAGDGKYGSRINTKECALWAFRLEVSGKVFVDLPQGGLFAAFDLSRIEE